MNIAQYIKINKPIKVRKGKFTTCYIYSDYALLHSCDSIKECLANGWFPEHRLIPSITYSNNITTNKDNYDVYKMPVYSQPSSLKEVLTIEDYELYQELRKLFNGLRWPRDSNTYHKYFINQVNNTWLDDSIKELLIDCYEACMNYSNRVFFEISPRNVAVNNNQLILLDCFFLE